MPESGAFTKALRGRFPPGTRVEFVVLDREEYSENRILGTVTWVDEDNVIFVKWDKDNGPKFVFCDDIREIEQ